MRTTSRPRIRVGGAMLAASVAFGVLCGCERLNMGSSVVSPCFRVLPEAHAAVAGQGTFVDVARVGRGVLPRFARLGGLPSFGRRSSTIPSAPPPPTGPTTTVAGQHDVCLVAYKGAFDPSRIPLLSGSNRTGTYAIVVVGVTSRKVRAVVLSSQLPAPLRKH